MRVVGRRARSGDGPGVTTGAGSASVWNACVADQGPTVVGS